MTGYPWSTGDALLAADLNAAIANAGSPAASVFQTPEHFGAVGDGTVDDSNAFDAYVAYLRTQQTASKPQMTFALGYGRVYYLSRSLNLTNFYNFNFDGNSSTIVSGDNTHTAIDMLGSSNCTLSNIKLLCGTQAAPGLVGITYGVYTDAMSAGMIKLDNVAIDGYYTRACVQNSGSEVNTVSFPLWINRYTSGTLGQTFVCIMDGYHHWPLNSRYVTSTLTADTYLTFLGILVLGGFWQNLGDGSGLWDGCGSQHHYRGLYIYVAQTVPGAVLSFIPASNYKLDFIFEVHVEVSASCVFYLTGASAIVLTGFKFIDPLVMVTGTGSVFKAAPGVTVAQIVDADLHVPAWLNAGSLLFDTPSKYYVVGKMTLLNAYKAHYNAPAGGFLQFMMNDSTGFTPGVYGMVEDQNGATISALSGVLGSTMYVVGATTLAGTVGFNGTAPIAKRTGWTAATGTATRTTFITGSVTLPALAEHVKALIDDLTSYGLIGP